MKLWPKNKQWKNWTLPSKYTVIGTLCGLISVGVIFLEYTYDFVQYILPKKCSITVKVQLDFKYSDENGILVKGNPLLLITNTGINAIAPLVVDVDMFSFDRGISKVTNYIKLNTYTHGHLIFESKVEPGQTIDHELIGLKSWNYPVLYLTCVQMYVDNIDTPQIQEHFLIVESDETEKSKSFRKAEDDEINRIKAIISSFTKKLNQQIR